ncbi:MAG TPA: hypothetical protein VFO29_08260 [Candidatus Rubrimentiphilum sp.]|nr:hypothetical protein [Candidatus Rubrimentiphilum sp.]
MFLAIRRYNTSDVNSDELKTSLDRNFLPKVSEVPGFCGYYAIDAGSNQLTTVSIFETREGEQASTKIAAEFVAQYFPGKLNRVGLEEGNTIVDRTVARV